MNRVFVEQRPAVFDDKKEVWRDKKSMAITGD